MRGGRAEGAQRARVLGDQFREEAPIPGFVAGAGEVGNGREALHLAVLLSLCDEAVERIAA